jgi:hypothetical protein
MVDPNPQTAKIFFNTQELIHHCTHECTHKENCGEKTKNELIEIFGTLIPEATK